MNSDKSTNSKYKQHSFLNKDEGGSNHSHPSGGSLVLEYPCALLRTLTAIKNACKAVDSRFESSIPCATFMERVIFHRESPRNRGFRGLV